MCVCVCVCVCERERERERETAKDVVVRRWRDDIWRKRADAFWLHNCLKDGAIWVHEQISRACMSPFQQGAEMGNSEDTLK